MSGKSISPLGALASASDRNVKLTPTGLRVLNPDLSYDDWRELLFSAAALGRMTRWWVGDLILWGEGAYEDKVDQAISLTGLAEGTVRNIVSVCKRVPLSRRRERLGISKHAIVTPLAPAEQDYWLREADKNDWTREEFRAAVERARNPQAVVVLPPQPLSPAGISTAAGALADVRETVEKSDLPPAEKARASQAIERSSETLRVAATIPSLRVLAERLIAEADPYDPQDGSEPYYLVPASIVDELRELVGEEAHV